MIKKLKCFLGIHSFGKWKNLGEVPCSNLLGQETKKTVLQKTCKECSIIKQKLV